MKNRSHRNCALEFINPNGGSGSRSLAGAAAAARRHRDSDWGSDIFPTFPGTPDNRFVSHTFRTQSSWIHGSGDPPNRSAPLRSSKEYVHVLKLPFDYELTASIEGRLHQQCLDLLLGAGKCSVRITRKFYL